MKFTVDDNYKSPLMFAVGLHVVLIILLVIHFKFSSEQPVTESSTHIIQAAVSANQLRNPTPTQQNVPKPVAKNPAPVAKPTPPQQQVIKQQPPIAAKQPPTPQPTQQLAIEQQAQAELALQKAQALAQKKAAQQAALKLVQQQTASALNDQLQDQSNQQKQAAQKQQLQNAQQATQQLLQQELSTATPTNDTTTNTVSAAADQGQIDKYKALIIQAISQQWIVPDIKNKNESCKILVHLAPGGVVLSVTVTQSSGDDVLDRSAEIAINKASPLPVPKDSALFNNFRDINLTVQPQGILADNNNN